jgi:ABC-type multidrug transport system ATPase subunit
VGADLGMHVILSSHLLEEVQRVSRSVVILDDGHVVAQGELAKLRQTPPELLVELDHHEGADPAPAFASTLQAAGLLAAVDGPRHVVVPLGTPSVYDTVRDALVDGGYSVRRLERRTASLEDVYLARSGLGRAE